MRFASDRLKDDSVFLLRLHKERIEFELTRNAISHRLQNDENFLLALLEIHITEQMVFFCSEGVLKNKEFVLKAMKRSRDEDLFMNFSGSKEIAREAAKLGCDLANFDDKIYNDKGLRRLVAKHSGIQTEFSQELFDLRMEFAYHDCKV